ncbi:NAD-binding protein [candidate division KSB1 bacterium]|nr:NAD-binding protein [candidate division KSB1 bacterium]
MSNALSHNYCRRLIARDFTPQAPLKHVAKDVRLICEEARRAGINTPAALTNERLFARAVERGLGEDDAVGVLKVLEQF